MKIIKITPNYVEFDNGSIIESDHNNDCCESHYVDFTSLLHQGAENADFPRNLLDLVVKKSYENENESKYDYESWQSFIDIKDKKGHKYTLTIYNSNNGYYGTDVRLILTNKWVKGYQEIYEVQK